ncbi:MAG: hypothetical protein Q9228_002487 [Teloschistes exilis]
MLKQREEMRMSVSIVAIAKLCQPRVAYILLINTLFWIVIVALQGTALTEFTPMASERSPLLHRLFEAQVAESPQGTALEAYQHNIWSYGDLNGSCNRLAHYVRECHGQGDVVALYLEKTELLIVAVLGVLKAGKAWLPLPLDAPIARLKQILDSCNVACILSAGREGIISSVPVPCVRVDDLLESSLFQTYSGDNLDDCGCAGSSLCHILFTSGSTGVPKGVMIEHRAVAHNVKVLVEMLGLGTQTRTLQFASPVFDIFALDLFMTFACGGCLVVAPPAVIMEDMTEFVRRSRTTYAQLTPTVIRFMDPARVPSLQILVSSGEALPEALGNKWRDQVRLFNAYGPTETIVCTVQELSGNDLDPACIGQAVEGLDVCLLDDTLTTVVPDGEVGQICVAGPQLFRGYCSTQAGLKQGNIMFRDRRFYQTGDLGRLEGSRNNQRTIRYLGRRDGQVKVHGIRVSLEEVEKCIASCFEVRNCAVTLLRRHGSESRLCGIVVPDAAESVVSTSSDLTRPAAPVNVLEVSPRNVRILREVRNTTAESLQEHAIPSSWWLVDSLPLTASGKTDRMRLRSWLEKLCDEIYSGYQNDIFARSSLVGAVAKSNDVQLIQSLWARVLNRPVEGVDPASSFVELGADSLDIIRLVSEARKSGLPLTYTQIYTARSINQLVLRREEQAVPSRSGAQEPAYRPFTILPHSRPLAPLLQDVAKTCGVSVAEIEDIYPCTPYQSALMVLDLKNPGSYLCIFDWTLPQDVDLGRLKAAWNTLIADEPVLRNRLVWDADAQEIWQVTVQRREASVDWTKKTFDLPMTLSCDLCRACIQWQDEVHRWRYSIKIHHSIVDGWSLRLMLNRLKSTYYGETLNRPPTAPFSHYVRGLIEHNRQHQVACRNFWQRNLEGFSQPDFPPPLSEPHYEVHSTAHAATHIAIDLQNTASAYGVTPATVLYGTAALVLGAHSRSEDLVFGLILAGRDTGLSGIGEMIGPAFAVVPFRSHINRHATLKDHFEGIERRVIDIIPHQHYGLQQIKSCGPGAIAACDFGCLIVVQPEDEMLAGAGLWEEALGQSSGLADNIPLSFELILAEKHVLIKCNHDPAVVPAEVVTTMLGHFKCALQDLCSKGRQDFVRNINFDEQDEVTQMLAWTHEYGAPVDRCLHELFSDVSQKYPKCIAIDDEATQQQYSYRQLDILTSGLSAFLCSKHDICAGTVVPVAMEKSALAVMVMLAILRSGAVYVPIDPDWPLERVRYIMGDTRASVILCSPPGVGRYSGLARKVIQIKGDSWQHSVVAAAENSVRPTDLALIMYTSGSTGRPKGVMLEHRALSTSLSHLAKAFGLRHGMRHLQFSSFVYDVSIADIFIPLMTGARICIPTEESRRNRLSTTIKDMGIESAILTPSVVELLDLDECASLKTIITGGEMPKSSMIRTWAPRVQLLNAYGPTEASITSTVGARQAADGAPNNIGRNITGWHWIVGQDGDGSMYPVPRGCVGEIIIAGHCLARGYLSNNALTAESFVEAPHLTIGLPSNRVYRTGDLGRYANDGSLRIIGRKDRLVKINGIRIDPGEPEFQLRQLGGIFTTCVVDCVEDDQGHPRLVVFIPSPTRIGGKDGKDPAFRVTCREAREKLAEILPPRLIPTLFFPVQSIPRTASDKVDLKSLRDQLQRVPNAHSLFGVGQDEIEHEPSGRAPATPAEAAVEAALRRVFFRAQSLTATADFFLLGGDSFLAIRLVSALKDIGFTVTVQDVYTHSSLESLARVAKPLHSTTPPHIPREKGTTSHVSSLVVSDTLRAEVLEASQLSSASIEDIYPASPFQEGLAAISQQESASSGLYTATMAFQLAMGLDVARLHQAFEWVVAQNPIWRTRLVHTSHGTMQAVQHPRSIDEIANKGRSSYFRWWIEPVGNVLMLSAHHALYDAWTIHHLLEDVNYNYMHPNEMRPGRLPYRQFIEHLSTVDQDAARTFWASQLREAFLCQYPSLPPCSRPPRASSCTNDTVNVDFQGIREMKVSPATVVATSMALALSAYCYSDDICYGITLSGRDDAELGNIAGPTLSTVPMRLRLCRDHSLHSVLHETQSLLLKMRDHQHLSLHEMARLPVQDVQDALRFRTLLVIQHDSAEPGLDQDSPVVQRMIPEKCRMHVNYPLVLIVDIDHSNHHLRMRLEYDPACLDDTQARRFLQHLKRIVTQCSLTTKIVGDVELLTDVDLIDIASWNPPPTRTDAPVHLHHAFDRLAAAQPEKPAVDSCCPEPFFVKRLSYRELDILATRLSESIRSLVPHALFIGLCLSKSPLAVIAMLATWKAGRTFVTLDPSAPSGRISTVLREFSGTIVVLTEPAMIPLLPETTLLVLDPSSSTMHPNLLDRALQGLGSPAMASIAASHNAYVMFTSGTSGTPKGVVISHDAIALSVKGYASSVCLTSDARMLQFAAFTFDTCILEIFATLTVGGCLCIPSDAQRFGGGLVDAIQSLRVNQLIVTPTVAQLIPPENVTSVQGVMLVGEPPSPPLIEKWASRMPSVRMMNGYGPTEAAVHASTNFDLSPSEACNIGHTSAGQLFITVPGRIDKLAAIGTTGELIVCGDSLAEGYLNKPDLTAQAFGTSLPWMSSPMRYYRTGDLARYSSKGSIEYLGRRDLQVKLRGQRIELQEVQWQVIQYGRFPACVVDILPSELLVAYLVPENPPRMSYTGPLPPNTLTKDIIVGLRSYLSSVLPTFMIPALYIPISAVPQTASGKVDRRRLRDSVEAVIDHYRITSTAAHELATTKEEKLLSKVWAGTLAIPEDQISIHDNISLLGGDSVTVIRIMAAARKCGLYLPLSGVYLNSTLKTMATAASTPGKLTAETAPKAGPFTLLRNARASAVIAMAAQKCNVDPELIQDLYPCTDMQEGLMISSAMSPGAYFNQEVYTVASSICMQRLRSSIQTVWRRHPILRTRIFLDHDSQSVQAVVDEEAEIVTVEGKDVQELLRGEVKQCPTYGERLCRVTVLRSEMATHLIFSRHHAVFDGWSQSLFLEDIEQEYHGRAAPIATQQHFSSFMRHVLETQESSEGAGFWQHHLAGSSATAIPQISTSAAFEVNQRYTLKVPIPSHREYSLSTIAEASWALLLARYAQTDDVCFGTIRSGRTCPIDGIETMLGPTIAAIPRRLRPISQTSCQGFLAGVQSQIDRALQWEPFGRRRIRSLGPGPEQACKFYSMLVVQMALSPQTEHGLLTPQPVSAEVYTRGECLLVECQPQDNQLAISISYDDHLISSGQVRWIAYHFSQLLVELTTQNEKSLGELDMAGPETIDEVRRFNDTAIVPCYRHIDDLFVERSHQWRGATAIDASDAVLTYNELDLCSSRFAAILDRMGVSKGDVVPLLMTKSAAMVVTMLAILKLRAAYAPLATDSPIDRLKQLLERVHGHRTACTLDQERLVSSLPTRPIYCNVSDLLKGLSDCPDSHGASQDYGSGSCEQAAQKTADTIAKSELAYILFTSGSTGSPKGVLIEHSALATTILENGRRSAYEPGTVTLSFAAYTFDVNVMDIYLTILHGGCLCIPSEKQRLHGLSRYINEKKIETAMLTPTAVRNFLRDPSEVPSLQTIRVGGESMSKAIIERWASRVKIVNSYGPTETCVDACQNSTVTSKTNPNDIGFPIGTHLWVVEPENRARLVPIGVSGELLVSGPKLARGYLNDEEATTRAFIDGTSFPWFESFGDRLYTTGDIVRQGPDGSVAFLGRKDLQLKINGFRIETSEVESAIEGCPGVSAAVVEKAQFQQDGPEVLVAFFTMVESTGQKARGDLLAPTEEIRCLIESMCSRAEKALMPYMRPHSYWPLDSIPYNLNGKVDRHEVQQILRKLPLDQLASYRSGTLERREPATMVQKILQALWAQVLSMNPTQIGLDSDFIGLGGTVLKNSGLEYMADCIERGRQSTDINKTDQDSNRSSISYDTTQISQIAAACWLDNAEIEDVYPSTATQEALMAVTMRLPQAYIVRELYRLPPSVDLKRFRSAWEIVAESNPILRTRICSITASRGIEMVQAVCRHGHVWSEVTELDDKPLEVSLGQPLVRHRLSRSPAGTIYELSRHHAVYDAISMKLIWDDLSYAYSSLASPPARPPYREYIQFLCAQDKDCDLAFWRDFLNGFQGKHYPHLPSTDYVCQAASDTSKTLVTAVQWNNECRFTFATVARAAWGLVLAIHDRGHASSKDICFASTSSGRTVPVKHVDQMTGPTIGTVPMRLKFEMEQPIDQYLAQVHDQSTATLAHEHYGMHQIRKIGSAARAACSTTNLLVIQAAESSSTDELPLGLEPVDVGDQRFVEPYGLIMECMHGQSRDTITLSVSYDVELLTEQEATNTLHQTSWMIAELNYQCSESGPIRQLLWSLADNQIPQLLACNPRHSMDPDACLHDIFNESAKQYPQRVAIDAHDGLLNYDDLNAAAEALASSLRAQYDVKPGHLVPLCFEKSCAMIVAILGILKAGAGYVPLDIGSPQARLDHMVQETAARVLIVSPLQAKGKIFSLPTLVYDRNHSHTLSEYQQLTAHPQDIAYVTFTSGTTGRPKGVITEHGSARLSILEHCKRYQHNRHGANLRTLQYSSYTFDASVLDIFATFAQGGCLCLPSEDDRLGNLQNFILDKQVNFADLTPTLAILLDLGKLPQLKVMAIGGEMAPRSLIGKLTDSRSPLEYIVNSYGPTEAAIGCAAGEITPKSVPGCVGKQVGGSLWIVDETNHDHLLPVSCRGELAVSGPTLARGYLNADQLTRQAFIESAPWLAKVGETRFYKTGDLACIGIDGIVEILGRKEEEQVKLHGIRVELGEIEAVMRSCPSLAAAPHLSAAKIDLSGNVAIVAFVCISDQRSASALNVLSPPSSEFQVVVEHALCAMREIAPEHMIPRLWLPVSSWPFTASGKTDRRRLAAACTSLDSMALMEYQRASTNTDPNGTYNMMTAAEKLLADAWRLVLHLDHQTLINPQDDFFKIGGDSLGVIMLVAHLQRQGISVTAHDIFVSRTLRAIAVLFESLPTKEKVCSSSNSEDPSWVEVGDTTKESTLVDQSARASANSDNVTKSNGRLRQNAGTVKAKHSKSVQNTADWIDELEIPFATAQNAIEDVYPATHAQLLFLIEGQKSCRSYYAWSFISPPKSASIAQIQRICMEVASRHPILRTSFYLSGRQCYQVVKTNACDFDVLFYRGSPEAICGKLDNSSLQPTCFGRVLTRFRLCIDIATGEQRLALGLSHAQYDGFCLANIFQDLSLAYSGRLPTAQPTFTYRQFIDHVLATSNKAADDFWRSTLQGSRPTSIVNPINSGLRPVMDHSIIKVLPFVPRLQKKINYVTLLKTAWVLVLHQLSRVDDITFGNLVSGRHAPLQGVQDIVGPCLNVIPVRMKIDRSSSLEGFLQLIEDQYVATMPYELIPMDRIAQQAGWSRHPAPWSIFQYQNLPDEVELENADDAKPSHEDPSSKWSYAGNASYGGGQLQAGMCWLMAWPIQNNHEASFRFTYSPQTLPTPVAEEIMRSYCQIVQALNECDITSPLASLLDIPFDNYKHLQRHTKLLNEPHAYENGISCPSVPNVSAVPRTIMQHLETLWEFSLPHDFSSSMFDDTNTSFFDMGGDSISAAELAFKSSEAGLALTLQDVIDFPTMSQQGALLAGLIERPVRERVKLVYQADHRFH